MRSHDLSRRRFLALAGSAAATGACSSSAPAPPASIGDVQTVNVSALAPGSLEPVGTTPVCIGRDASGVYAMTLTCTHMGCNIGQSPGGMVSAQGLVCGCHGSRFDANGNVTNGPASQPLTHFNVTVDANGVLTIHGGQTVDAHQRLNV